MSFLLSFNNSSFCYLAENPATAVSGGYLISSSYLCVTHPFENNETEFYRHGWHSWSPTAWMALSDEVKIVEPATRRLQCDDRTFATAKTLGGSGIGAVRKRGTDEVLFVGALDLCARVEAKVGEISARFLDATNGVFFVAYGTMHEVTQCYVKLLREKFGARVLSKKKNVWCSWYAYGQNISADEMQHVLSQCDGFDFDVFQLDDGWQREIGDWTPNKKFPKGMKDFAGSIRAKDLEPGIWLAPLLVRPQSQLFEEHQDWILRDRSGELLQAGFNWGAPTYALDARLPAVRTWLAQLFETVLQWGYTYLKLDFMYAGALLDRDGKTFNGEDVYRDTLKFIRSVVGEKTYLLLCGSPIFASLGVADGLRIGPDVAPYWDKEERSLMMNDRSWPSSKNAVRTCAHRIWLKELVDCDTDVVYFRTRYNLLRDDERCYLKQLAQITGFKGTSDPLHWLLESEKAELKNFLQSTEKTAQLGEFTYRIDEKTADFSTLF